MAKFLKALAVIAAIVFSLLLLGMLPAAWNALTAGGTWDGIGEAIIWLIVLGVASLGLQKAGESLEPAAEVRRTTTPAAEPRRAYAPMSSSQAPERDVRAHFYNSALAQSLLDDTVEATLAGANLMVTDGLLQSYYEEVTVDWRELWSLANQKRFAIPPFDERPYWVHEGPGRAPVPLTNLAFWSANARLRIAEDPNTDSVMLAILAEDPYNAVRTAAARRV